MLNLHLAFAVFENVILNLSIIPNFYTSRININFFLAERSEKSLYPDLVRKTNVGILDRCLLEKW